MSDWFENDALFERELRRGHSWAQRLAEALTAQGLTVELTPLVLRERIEQRGDFANEGDLVVSTGHGPVLLESKSRDLTFTCADDYPFQTALVDTVSGWNQKTDKPKAIVLTSQPTGARLVISIRRTRHLWRQKRRRDATRGIVDTFYEVPRSALMPFDVLVEWLKAEGPPDSQNPTPPRVT